jgi:hypothetical protein
MIPLSKHETTGDEGPRHVTFGLHKKALRRLVLDKSAMMQKDNVLREPSRLTHVMCHDNYLDAAVLRLEEQPLDGESRSGVEARGRLVEKQDLWIEAKRARKA